MSNRFAVPILLALVLAGLAPKAAFAAGNQDPDWPCVQPKMAQISAGQVWTGPPIDGVGDSWRQDGALADLAREIASRRTDMAAATATVAKFAASAGAERNQRLTTLFAGVLSIINAERASIMAGIGRYARRQQALADKIEAQSAELGQLPDTGGTEDQIARREELQDMQAWDTRIFQDREKSLTYVCELPVTLEKRAFQLGKAIAAEIGK